MPSRDEYTSVRHTLHGASVRERLDFFRGHDFGFRLRLRFGLGFRFGFRFRLRLFLLDFRLRLDFRLFLLLSGFFSN